ncbi:hypothetical protein CYLTODRAFT_494161 [Cylindrobasidium torrendii FP15055 ss-10]|uniref:WD40 repeat-like protein n=1 Tax=Cylindrobasidium torrendii FP15055 ss-10 TaxID=1314674 RepID=A0A0D7AYZ5_9AGAR|nr:hypothetical protein CYLTODRAFT_494161 [Cylindrobasidium torrendii FP15055 ss-10]
MPRDLPGLYWDEERKRYFPLSSKPKAPLPAKNTVTIAPMVQHGPQPLALASGKAYSFSERNRTRHKTWCSLVSASSSVTPRNMHLFNDATSMCFLNNQQAVVGDKSGWLYTLDPTTKRWVPEINVHPSGITDIAISENICVATCLGPVSKIYARDVSNPDQPITLWQMSSLNDLRKCHLHKRSLLLGAGRKWVHVQLDHVDFSVSDLNPRMLPSDVLSMSQSDDNLIYAGCRNGSIFQVDLRVKAPQPHEILSSSAAKTVGGAVVHLETIRETQLLVSRMNGDLITYDLRYPTYSSPCMTFKGHVNLYTERLGVVYDSVEDTLFAAGSDGVVRGWSLRTEDQIFKRDFVVSANIPSLQLVRNEGGGCVRLLAAQGRQLHEICMGMRQEV